MATSAASGNSTVYEPSLLEAERQPLDRWLAARRQGPGAPGRVAPAALAVPSQGHHQRGTPQSAKGCTTHLAWESREPAEKATQAAARRVTTT
jgi:hypothetical protein